MKIFFYLVVFYPLLLGAESAFRSVTPGYRFSFPKDLGAHKDYATEWWYFTGHLTAEDGSTFGTELTFFRVGLKRTSRTKSPWSADSIYIVHFAVTDDKDKVFYHKEVIGRGAFGDASVSEKGLDIKVLDFEAAFENEHLKLKAKSEGREIRLTLESRKAPVLHGENGVSIKGSVPGEASLYLSLTRLVGEGELILPGKKVRLKEASLWMDHEVMTSPVISEKKGWDWFAVQFDDPEEELMVYNLRENGSKTPFSSGTFIEKQGTQRKLSHEDFTIEVLDRWKSPRTKITYPSKWRITIPKLDKVFTIVPTVSHQELLTTYTAGVTYWEGRALVFNNAGRIGEAYVELVGYPE